MSNTVTDKFTESVYVLANEPSVALYRLQEHVRRSLPELAQHKVSSASAAKHLPQVYTQLLSRSGVLSTEGPKSKLRPRELNCSS